MHFDPGCGLLLRSGVRALRGFRVKPGIVLACVPGGAVAGAIVGAAAGRWRSPAGAVVGAADLVLAQFAGS